ncbi:hypothetical protein CesoFtcFv8_009743 [Champsocephalus esox]|uniref:Uncharacterized protein n=1 Tax=Champsocephalus esox TaxID=159716 RepID=A0AAN8GZ04_9TELE|nr:hypothetical protein CesoFtcFv8_009743 [Champsocephalus esox]
MWWPQFLEGLRADVNVEYRVHMRRPRLLKTLMIPEVYTNAAEKKSPVRGTGGRRHNKAPLQDTKPLILLL